jgi:translation initiation factor 2D
MTPGLIGWSSEIKSGDIVAVTLQNAAPIAVGVAAFDIGRLAKAAGERGKAVYLVHCYRDELWGMGTKIHPPAGISDTSTQLEDATQQLSLEDNMIEADEPAKITETPSDKPIESHEEEKLEPSTSGLVLVPCKLIVEIDDAFKAASIYGLYKAKASDAQTSISLPLPSSTFVSSYLNPFLPDTYAQYNFKKTSWKKAATFLKKYLEKDGVIKTKDRGGETVILSINWNHNLISEFQPYNLGNRETDKSGETRSGQPSATSPYAVRVLELFKPSGKAFKAILEFLSKS